MIYEYIAIGGLSVSLLLVLALGWLWMRVLRIDRVRKQFLIDDENKMVDTVLITHDSEIKRLSTQLEAVEHHSAGLANANKKNFQKIGFIRFNPYGDAGGSISFVLALLDASNNGIVLSSLHGRDGTRTYAKEIKNGVSTSQLTEEEQKAIQQAI